MIRRAAVLAALTVLAACDNQSTSPSAPSPIPAPTEPGRSTTPVASPTPAPTPTPVPTPTPMPQVFIPYQKLETSRLFHGLQLRSEMVTEQGEESSKLRTDPSNYAIELKVSVTVPKAIESLTQLDKLNPSLKTTLPGLAEMMKDAVVSPFYHSLYEIKVKEIQRNIARLDALMSTHNFYDCETILELVHPKTQRKVLLVQGEMDVDADGSDADRLVEVDGTSTFYQPFTSYKWPKRTSIPNQFLAGRKDKLKKDEAEFSKKGLPMDRNRELRQSIDTLKREIVELENFSFLISRTDPFIVLPGFMLQQKDHPFAPRLGDYAVVVFGGKVYPAIFGDVGPRSKVGEASLFICKELRANSNAYNRPVNDLTVTYLVFPGTADTPFGPPDLVKWRTKVAELLNEIGGATVELHEWPDLIPKPSPTPTPTPTPAPSPSPSQAASPTPGS